MALTLCATRAAVTIFAQKIGSRLANDVPAVRKWGWSGLISQAGVALGIGAVIERTVPSIGPDIRALVVATIAINEVVGPVLFKLAVDRNGESRSEAVLANDSAIVDAAGVPQP